MADIIDFNASKPGDQASHRVRPADGLAGDAGPGSCRIAAGRLRAFIERIGRLTDDKQAVADDIKAVFAEAKSEGFEPKIMRRVMAIMKQGPADYAEFEAVLNTYLTALEIGNDDAN